MKAQALWIGGAAAVGFAASAVFAGMLHLPRSAFLLPAGAMFAAFLYAYVRSSGVDLAAHFRERPLFGIAGAAVAGAFVVSNVLSQPASNGSEGWGLAAAVLWAGGVYGTLDALLLTVMPVVAMSLAFERGNRVLLAVAALAASVAVTAAYHLGYPEFRGPQVVGPIIGNAIFTAAYLATRSPLSPILAHIAMHVAAVLHGIETTIQLPPHY